MSFFSDLFSSGESEIRTELKSVPTKTPEQQAALKQLLGTFSGAAGRPVTGIPDTFVPRTDEEQTYFDWVGDLGEQGAMKKLLSGEPAYDIGPEWADAMFEDVYLPERKEQLRESLNVARGETAKYRGSPSGNLLAKIQGDFAREVPAAKTQFAYTEEQARRNAIDQALSRTGTAIPAYTNILSEAGDKARNIEQEEVASILNKYLLGGESNAEFDYNPAMNPNVQILMSLLGIQPLAVTQNTTGTQKGAGLGYGLLAGASEGFGEALGDWLFT